MTRTTRHLQFPATRRQFNNGRKEKAQRKLESPRSSSYRHLLETSSHSFLQKVRDWVDGLIERVGI